MENPSNNKESYSVNESSYNDQEQESEHIAGNNETNKQGKREVRFGNKFTNAVAIGGVAVSQLQGGISEVNAQRLAEQRNSAENKPPVKEQYHPDEHNNNEEVSGFVIDETGGSGLDSSGFPIEKEVVIQAPLVNKIETYGGIRELIPSLEELNEYEVIESKKLDSYQDTKIVSDYFNIYSFALKDDMFPGDTFRVATVKLDEYLIEEENQELVGLGFSVHNIMTLKGPGGDEVKLGEYHNLYGWYTKNYLLMEYKDVEGHEYSFATTNFPEEKKERYGKSQNSFLAVSHQLYDDIVKGDSDSIEVEEYELNRELKLGLVQEIYDVQDMRELEEIAKEDKSVKVILGITEAINSYPGDEAVTREYLEKTYEYNKEYYGFKPVKLENEEIQPEKITRYLLNYVDKDGNSWYQDFLDFQSDIQSWYKEHLELKRNPWGYNTYYHDQSRIIRDLNLLSSGLKVEGKNVQPFEVANLYRSLIGLPAPMVMSAPVENVRDLIPSEISQYDGGYFFSGMIRDTYISPHFEDFANVKVGDMLISQEKNHLITIFYESETEEGSSKWAFDVDEDGMVRLYKWNNHGKRLYPTGPLKSPYGRYDLLRHVKNLPIERKQQHWEVEYGH